MAAISAVYVKPANRVENRLAYPVGEFVGYCEKLLCVFI
jgi:hypothetical protein